MEIKTLQELGYQLPIPGPDGKPVEFKFRPWKLAEEKKIAEIKNRTKPLGKFVREVFELMLLSYDGRDWSSIDGNERKLILANMAWANVFYLYCVLRVEAMGAEIKMGKFDCPECEAEVKNYRADLSSLEVKIAGEGWNKECDYALKHPFEIGDVMVRKVRFGVTPWLAMDKIAENGRKGLVKEAMLAASIIGAITDESDKPVTLQKEKILEGLSKRDLEGYYDALDEHNGGPILGLEVECGSCGHKFDRPLNWGYEYFFESSSL